MLEKLKNLFSKPEPEATTEQPPKTKKTRKPKEETPKVSEKELATQRGDPYVSILKVDVDPNNINSGSFELDWNDKFVLNLIRAGYKHKNEDSDQIIVDRWFQTVCRNIALEVYEQQAADPRNPEHEELRHIRTRDLGNGRTEVS